MKKFFYSDGQSKHGPFNTAELKTKNISPETLIWYEGLDDWKLAKDIEEMIPILELIPPPLPISNDDKLRVKDEFDKIEQEDFHTAGNIKNDEVIQKYTANVSILKIYLKIGIFVAFILILTELYRAQFIENLIDGKYYNTSNVESKAELIDSFASIVYYIFLFTFLLTAVSYLKWIYNSNKNLNSMIDKTLKFSPGWSIGYYFIPIATFYKPYQAMKEIWVESTRISDAKKNEESKIIQLWWALWLINLFLNNISSRVSNSAVELNELLNATALNVICAASHIPLCIISLSLISKIYKMQKRFFEVPHLD